MDYKDLFKKVENAIAVYTSELDHSAGADPRCWCRIASKKGETARQCAGNPRPAVRAVEPPRASWNMHYFCGNTEIPTDLQEREPQRAALYKATASLVRAYANIADELEAAGYSGADIARIRQQLDHYLKLREIIRKASGESLDLKVYEADMRHLIDTYIQADEPEDFALRRYVPAGADREAGIAEAIAQQLGARQQERRGGTIENNVRSKIIKEHLHDQLL